MHRMNAAQTLRARTVLGVLCLLMALIPCNARALTLADYAVTCAKGYTNVTLLSGGSMLLTREGPGGGARLLRCDMRGNIQFELLSVESMHHTVGRGVSALPDGRVLTAFLADNGRICIRAWNQQGQDGRAFYLPKDTEYFFSCEQGVLLVQEDGALLTFLDLQGDSCWSLRAHGEERIAAAKPYTDGENLFLFLTLRTQPADARYRLIHLDAQGRILWQIELSEQEMGFALYGDHIPDGKGGFILSGPDKEDYKMLHVLRIDAEGKQAYHKAVKDECGAWMNGFMMHASDTGVALYATLINRVQDVYQGMSITLDEAGTLVQLECRDFSVWGAANFACNSAPDGSIYMIASTRDSARAIETLYAVPFEALAPTLSPTHVTVRDLLW